MANTKKSNKDKKAKKPERLGRNGKIFIITVLSMIIVAVLTTTIVTVTKKKKAERTVRVDFYGLSDDYCEILKELIPVEEKITLKCDVLSEGSLDLGAIKEKYDMLFTWKGEITDALEASSEEIPAKILDSMPSSLRNKKCAPILLDHCELAYSKEIVQKMEKDIPNSFPSFLNYISEGKKYVFSPFFCNGADDRILTAFVGAIIQAIGGKRSYDIFIDELRKDTPFMNLLDMNLGSESLTLRAVLDMLKTWPKEGYAHPAWFNAKGGDLLYFTEDKQVAVFFTYLHDHRNIPYNVISNYEAFVLPPASSTIEFGIIAPSISGMLISDNSNAKRYLGEFFTSDAQEMLSDRTKLAPVHSRAQAYDRQSDDVRYWAASCPAGAIPDVYNAAFQRNPERFKTFSDELRNYIR